MRQIAALRELQRLEQKQESVRGSLENNATKLSSREREKKPATLFRKACSGIGV
jgi:hypothetical protein